MKVALVYDRVNKWGGAERVLLTLHEMFPKAPLYTSVYNPETAEWASVFPKVYTSFLQKLPFLKTRHELLAPLMPLTFESFNFDEYDLVISVTSEAAKGIITKPETKHVCYMLTPTRYLWSGYGEYFKDTAFKGVARPFVYYLRSWDRIAAQRPDVVVGISSEVQKRIKKFYGRESKIIYPPVELSRFEKVPSENNTIEKPYINTTPLHGDVEKHAQKHEKGDGYYLIVSRLVSYKKVGMVIKTFNKLDKKLVVVGVGHEEKKLKKLARDNIIFTGHLTDEELVNYYINAKALIFPQVEDFGLVAVEAQAAGTPVIAYKFGGALDTVVEGKTGVFFNQQTVDSLVQAVKKLDTIKISRSGCLNNAQRFSKERFKKELFKLINNDKR